MFTTLPQFPQANERYLLEVLTLPDQEPIGYDEVASYCRITETIDFAQVVGLAIAARRFVEEHTRLAILNTQFRVSYDRFDPWGLRLPRRPVTDPTTVSVQYTDQNGTQQTLPSTSYTVDRKDIWTYIRPAWGVAFPFTAFKPNAVQVTFNAGMCDTSDLSKVDNLVKVAIKAYAKHLYDNRDVAVPGSMMEVPLGLRNVLSLLGAPEA